jgi:hypothetical protein
LAFDAYKQWIRDAFDSDDPVMKKVFEPVEEGFDTLLCLDELNADDFNYFYRKLRSQDGKMQERLRENPALVDHVDYWNKMLELIKEDDRIQSER